jgi:hypothetical protein
MNPGRASWFTIASDSRLWHDVLTMWIASSYTARALVWLAAAMLPCDVLWAGSCVCGEQVAAAQGKAAGAHRAACCCNGGAVCQCCHGDQNLKKSACCASRARIHNASPGPVAKASFCPCARAPESRTTPAGSSGAKQSNSQTGACLAVTASSGLCGVSMSSIGNWFSSPATSPERLSVFCRLNI